MIILDQKGFGEIRSVVETSTTPDCVFFKKPQARHRFSRVVNSAGRTRDLIRPLPSECRDSRESAEEIQRGAFHGKKTDGSAPHQSEGFASGDLLAIGDMDFEG